MRLKRSRLQRLARSPRTPEIGNPAPTLTFSHLWGRAWEGTERVRERPLGRLRDRTDDLVERRRIIPADFDFEDLDRAPVCRGHAYDVLCRRHQAGRFPLGVAQQLLDFRV